MWTTTNAITKLASISWISSQKSSPARALYPLRSRSSSSACAAATNAKWSTGRSVSVRHHSRRHHVCLHWAAQASWPWPETDQSRAPATPGRSSFSRAAHVGHQTIIEAHLGNLGARGEARIHLDHCRVESKKFVSNYYNIECRWGFVRERSMDAGSHGSIKWDDASSSRDLRTSWARQVCTVAGLRGRL